jgi:hypothetical protein
MSELKQCPNCKAEGVELLKLDEGFRKRLNEAIGVSVAEAVCSKCAVTFEKKLSHNSEKEAKRAAKEASRLSLWRRRVDIMRDARDRFASKDYSGAVVSYEKYLRIIEMIYDVKPNQLKVSFFNNPARAKELVLITTTYWDLIRIYDQSESFHKRFNECAEKLIEFLPFAPMYAEMLHRLEDHKKIAKHKDVFQKIYKQVQKKKKRCFIATAAFEYAPSPYVDLLCAFRDQILAKSCLGRGFIKIYYLVSPLLAHILDQNSYFKSFTRKRLITLSLLLKQKYSLKT